MSILSIAGNIGGIYDFLVVVTLEFRTVLDYLTEINCEFFYFFIFESANCRFKSSKSGSNSSFIDSYPSLWSYRTVGST